MSQVTVHSFRITPHPTHEETFPSLIIQNPTEGAPGSAFWYLGLGVAWGFSCGLLFSSNDGLLTFNFKLFLPRYPFAAKSSQYYTRLLIHWLYSKRVSYVRAGTGHPTKDVNPESAEGFFSYSFVPLAQSNPTPTMCASNSTHSHTLVPNAFREGHGTPGGGSSWSNQSHSCPVWTAHLSSLWTVGCQPPAVRSLLTAFPMSLTQKQGVPPSAHTNSSQADRTCKTCPSTAADGRYTGTLPPVTNHQSRVTLPPPVPTPPRRASTYSSSPSTTPTEVTPQ